MTSNLLAFIGADERGIYIGNFQIMYYALCIITGMLLATFLSGLLMKRRNMSSDFVFTLFIVCIPSALICTRLFYCITDGMPIREWFSWESIRNGGLSVIGGVIGGVGAGFAVCKIKKVNFLRAADCVVVNILIAQVLGRWGNFFNKEVYGNVVTNPSQQWFPFAVPISPDRFTYGIGSFSDPNSVWHYAFFFYEMLFNLIGWALLFTLMWKFYKKPNGLGTFGYFAWYGIVRSVMEPLRDPSYILSGGGVPWSLVFSILMIVFGFGGIALLLYLNYRREGSVFGSKTGDPCAITQFLTADKEEKPYYSKINILGANYPPRPPKEKKGKSAEVEETAENAENEASPAEPPEELPEESPAPEEKKTDE